MIIGVGVDIADRSRFHRTIERFGENFLKKIFTTGEIECCRSNRDAYLCFAEIFAAKEAVMKALRFGLRDGASFKEIEVLFKQGVEVQLRGKASSRAEGLGVKRIHLSFNSKGDMAIAVAVAEG